MVIRFIHYINFPECSEFHKVKFESKLARDNSIAKKAQDLSKNDLNFS